MVRPLKNSEQIKQEMVKLELLRDDLLEWLLLNMNEETIARIYITEHHIVIGINRPEEEE